MAVRFRKYFKECKPIQCNGKRSNQCPGGRPQACGGWAIEYRELSGRWVSKIFPDISKTQAKELLEEVKSNIRRKMVGLPTMAKIPTLNEYASTYLELCKTEKENTVAAKKRSVTAFTRSLGEYPLDKITPFIIEKYRVDRREKDKVKNSSINIDIAILSHIYTVAIKAGTVDKNPCKDVQRLKVTQTKDRILSQSEIALLLDRLQGKDRLMVLVGLFTGLRLGGVLCLSWHDIDFNNNVVTSSHKTGRLVSIPLSEYLKNELEGYRKYSPGDMVFWSGKINHTVISKQSGYFSKLFKDLGIHGVTFHTLRHTFSSILQGELGIGAVVVQGMTGHSSLSMLQKYSHTGLDNKKQAIQALTDHILSINTKTTLAIAQ